MNNNLAHRSSPYIPFSYVYFYITRPSYTFDVEKIVHRNLNLVTQEIKNYDEIFITISPFSNNKQNQKIIEVLKNRNELIHEKVILWESFPQKLPTNILRTKK